MTFRGFRDRRLGPRSLSADGAAARRRVGYVGYVNPDLTMPTFVDDKLASGLTIPAYDGNPDVGLLTADKSGLDDYGGSHQLNGGVHNLTDVKVAAAGGILQAYNGAAVVLDNVLLEVRFDLEDTATVTIRDTKWAPPGSSPVFGLYTQPSFVGELLIEDCEVIGAVTQEIDDIPFNISGTPSNQIVVRRTKFSGWEDGPNSGGYTTFEQCHIAGTAHFDGPPASHEDGIVISGPGAVVRYCHIDAQNDQSNPGTTGALSINADFGDIDDVLVENNFMDWGNIILTLEPKANTLTNIKVRDNIFGLNYTAGLINSEPTGVDTTEWTGNVDTNGDPVTDPNP